MQPHQPPQKYTAPLPREVIARLFAVLQLSYPKFITAKDDPEKLRSLWEFHLAKISGQSIEAAMRSMIDQFPRFAPTVGEFKNLAKSYGKTSDEGPQAICDKCHSAFHTQFHADECGNGRYQP